VISGGIFDVVDGEFMISGGCDSCAGIGAGSLELLITVHVGVFSPAERLDVSRAGALDRLFEEDRFDILLGEELNEYGERYPLLVVNTNRELRVSCGVHGVLVGWIPEVTPSLRESVATEL
jgi:hypothetical protein